MHKHLLLFALANLLGLCSLAHARTWTDSSGQYQVEAGLIGFNETTVVLKKDKRGLESWAAKLRGDPRTFTCEGVILELENGDEYSVPFFLLSADDLNVLRPGWESWAAVVKDQAAHQQESFLLRAQAQAYQHDRKVQQQIGMMQLQMQGYQAGLFDLWEVSLFPGPGIASPPLAVVVPGRDSRSAALEAVRRNPGFTPGPVSKVSRKY